MDKRYDFIGIGHLLKDYLYKVQDEEFAKLGLIKGQCHSMTLAEITKIQELLPRELPHIAGSVVNTLSFLSKLGAKCYLAQTVQDELVRECLKDRGIIFEKHHNLVETIGLCFVIITPDGERTFATYVPETFKMIDLDRFSPILKESKTLIIEGYLLRENEIIGDLLQIIEEAQNNNVEIVLTLSDVSIVKMRQEFFYSILSKGVDLLVGNEKEMMGLFEVSTFKKLKEKIKRSTYPSLITLGKSGLIFVDSYQITQQSAYEVEVVNKNGAGDAALGGYLFGKWKSQNLVSCLKIAAYGSMCILKKKEATLSAKNRSDIKSFLV